MNWRDWEPLLRSERGIIYLILNLENGMKYVGKSHTTFWDRYDGGKWWKYSSNRLLKSDYKEYGPDAFVVQLLETALESEELEFSEMVYIHGLNTVYPNGYNLKYFTAPGKEKMAQKGIEHSLEGKRAGEAKNIQEGKLPRESSGRCMRGSLNPMHGKYHSEETRKKIALQAKGRKISSDTRDKLIATARKGSKHHSAKAVLQIEPMTKDVIARFESGNLAASALGCRRETIYKALKNGCIAKGYNWKYAHETA